MRGGAGRCGGIRQVDLGGRPLRPVRDRLHRCAAGRGRHRTGRSRGVHRRLRRGRPGHRRPAAPRPDDGGRHPRTGSGPTPEPTATGPAAAGLPAVLVILDTPARLCRTRNAERDRPVPADVLTAQLRKVRTLPALAEDEGWDRVVVLAGPDGSADPDPRSGGGSAADAARRPHARSSSSCPASGWGKDPAGWLREVAVTADQVGFAGIAVMDHLIQIPQVDRAWEPIPEPWVTLGLLAGLDTSLRLGTLVSPVTLRPAGVIAKTAATLDVLSGGRAFCGLGAGWWEREHAAYGIDFPPARERLDRLEATIETMRALWATGTKPYAGRRVQLPGDDLLPAAGRTAADHRGRRRGTAHAEDRRDPGRRLQPAGRRRAAAQDRGVRPVSRGRGSAVHDHRARPAADRPRPGGHRPTGRAGPGPAHRPGVRGPAPGRHRRRAPAPVGGPGRPGRRADLRRAAGSGPRRAISRCAHHCSPTELAA